MHPAPSIIAFTTLSGLGFGLMAWLGIGNSGRDPLQAFLLAALAVVLPAAGLLASLLHLGQPRRFLKAFSQWRSSWLSREAVLSIATFVAFGLFAALWVLFGIRTRWLGIPAAALALATVFATSMIYAQLRSVPRWRSSLTPALFLVASLAGGALLAGEARPAPWLLAGLGLVQLAAWAQGDRSLGRSGTTLATATGLGALGRLRLLAPPHTGANYLVREMVYVVGRRHAAKLRVLGFLLAVVLPCGLALAPSPATLAAAALLHVAGMLVLRWLFFAEAEHVVGLYYGRR
jgi:DMSO reductase anchor subunit